MAASQCLQILIQAQVLSDVSVYYCQYGVKLAFYTRGWEGEGEAGEKQ